MARRRRRQDETSRSSRSGNQPGRHVRTPTRTEAVHRCEPRESCRRHPAASSSGGLHRPGRQRNSSDPDRATAASLTRSGSVPGSRTASSSAPAAATDPEPEPPREDGARSSAPRASGRPCHLPFCRRLDRGTRGRARSRTPILPRSTHPGQAVLTHWFTAVPPDPASERIRRVRESGVRGEEGTTELRRDFESRQQRCWGRQPLRVEERRKVERNERR